MTDARPLAEPLLELRRVRKSFNGVAALRDVDFRLFPGEVAAVLGDNGAGKSTLVKILSGVLRPDSGELLFEGKPVALARYDVAAARRLGVETVHQERSLGEKQPLWRNVFMGRHLANRLGFIDVRREKAATLALLRERLGLRGPGLDADAPVSVLSGGERQGLAIARAMYFQARVLILDEPTTALSLKETAKVLEFVEQVRARGASCVLISHNIGHAHRAADRFFLMDRGRAAGEYAKGELSEQGLMRALLEAASRPEAS